MLNENKKYARLAGLFWFIFGIFGMLSYMVADAKLLIADDAAATISNINSNMGLFIFGILAFIIGYGIFILLAGFLRKLFKSVDNKLTTIMMSLVIAGTAIVLAGKSLEIFALNATVEDAACLFKLRASIEMAGELFWGLWLFPLVLLIFKSDFIHKWVGWLLAVAAFVHLLWFAAYVFIPSFVSTVEMIAAIAMPCEFIPAGYLLIKGVKNGKCPRKS
ncbi:MAG: DUF4386 domain-containing protein [Oscillospiraceae bacterium]|nr:DUF4386 domain-containing protein [Oscillospiraceae bacterium]